MGTKIITLDPRFSTGEPTVQLVATPGRNGRVLHERTSLHMSKTASQSPAMDYIRTVEPRPGKSIVLVIGLGDQETYGPNRNGDGFPSEPVPGKITDDQVLTKHYKSYENAHVFENHVNHDPAKAIGKVIAAFWNPYMRRVEVLEDFDHDKAKHLLERITSGEFPSKSMGCFTAGTMVTLGDCTRKPIEDISVGDEVLTHEGRARTVTELHRRQYSGDMYTVRAEAQEPVECTGNHPFLVVTREEVSDTQRRGAGWTWGDPDTVTLSPQWVEARCLDKDAHLLLCPIDTFEQTPDFATRAFARLLGYYLAEGHTYSQRGVPNGIQLSVHQDDAVLREIDELCREFGTQNKPLVRQHPNSAVGRYIYINDARLAALCIEHAGCGAKTKRLSSDCMHWHTDLQRELLGAYANGDGHSPSKGPQQGTLKLSTANRTLGEQLTALSHRLGLVPSVNCLTHKAGKGFSAHDTFEYVLHFGKNYAQSLRDVCEKIVAVDEYRVRHSRRIYGNYVLLPIRELHSYVAETDVYNFEVEEDESYVAGGVVAHNCKIPYDVCSVCGNRAPTRKQYCDHLKFEMNRIDGDGTHKYAMNPAPKFFDSSWVLRPADRIGHMLKKVAYDSPYEIRTAGFELNERLEDLRDKAAALGKAADMEKVVSGTPDAMSTGTDRGSLKLLKNYSDNVAPGEAAKLPSSDVRVTIEYTPSDVVGTSDAMGLPMGLRDLIKFFMGRMGAAQPSEDELDCACKHASLVLDLFAEYPRFYDDALKTAGLLELNINEKLANYMWPPDTMTEDRKLVDSALYERRLPAAIGTQSPNSDVLTFTDPSGRTMRTNMGQARRTTRALEGDAQARKYVSGAGQLGLGTVLGAAGMGALLTGKRSPMRRVVGGLAVGAGTALGLKGVHEALRPTRISDLAGPKVMTNEGHVIPAFTQMKSAAWQPEMLYAVLRKRDGDAACAPLDTQRKLAVHHAACSAEVHDDLSPVLGPTLSLEKVALLLEQSISTLA